MLGALVQAAGASSTPDPYTWQKGVAIPATALLFVVAGGFLVPFRARIRSRRAAKAGAAAGAQPARPSSLDLLIGADGRLSTSKTIMFAWTVVIAYVIVALLFITPTDWKDALTHLDGTYFALLGGPYAAAFIAKVSVSTRVANGTLQKSRGDGTPRLSDLYGDGSQQTDLFDVQYVVFNLIAMGFVLSAFARATLSGFPEIPEQLIFLTGGPAAIYGMNKIIGSNKPAIFSVSPRKLAQGAQFTVIGQNFMPAAPAGDPAGACLPTVLVDGIEAEVADNAANNTTITATVPAGVDTSGPVEVRVVTPTGQQGFLQGALSVMEPAAVADVPMNGLAVDRTAPGAQLPVLDDTGAQIGTLVLLPADGGAPQ
jgi:hypothetical protein